MYACHNMQSFSCSILIYIVLSTFDMFILVTIVMNQLFAKKLLVVTLPLGIISQYKCQNLYISVSQNGFA